MEETKIDLINDLQLEADYASAPLDQLVAAGSKYVRDFRMNLKSIYKSKALSQKEVALLAVAIAATLKNETLRISYSKQAEALEASEAEIAEAVACASLLSSNNILYRFRHFVSKEQYEHMRAGIRMNIMMLPENGKEFFELMSLAVSAVNGCEMCVRSHEVSVLEAGGSEERIWDAVRVASILAGADRILP